MHAVSKYGPERERDMRLTRREILGASAAALVPVQPAAAQEATASGIEPEDRVFICNEDSNPLSVTDPQTNTADGAINLTSFDEDPRPPFRFVTGGITPTHVAM